MARPSFEDLEHPGYPNEDGKVRVFIDTEFTGLEQPEPRLISIALVSEDGLREFYAELAPESYMEEVSPWVRNCVLPLLEGGDCVLQPDELRQRLASWIVELGAAVVACDSADYDFAFLQAILNPWPANLDREPLLLLFDAERSKRFLGAVAEAFACGLRQHHALDDARANRMGWIAVS